MSGCADLCWSISSPRTCSKAEPVRRGDQTGVGASRLPSPQAVRVDLMRLVQSLEQACGEGGAADETKSEVYARLVTTEDRQAALDAAQEYPVVVYGPRSSTPGVTCRLLHPDP
jgi:hypothetical protein